VPEEGVATDELAVLCGEVDDLVSVSEREGVARGYYMLDYNYVIVQIGKLTLNSIPLHAVLASHLTKLGLDNVDERVVVKVVVVDLRTKVLLALGLELGIETSASVVTTSRLRSATALS
jgi:hypothetical protein